MTPPDGYIPVHHIHGCDQIVFYMSPEFFRDGILHAVDVYFPTGEQPKDGEIAYFRCCSCGVSMDFSEIPDLRHLL